MNCCDHDCNEGRDCPVRVARIGRRDYDREPLPPTLWRVHFRKLARFVLLGLLGWLIWVPLFYLLLRA